LNQAESLISTFQLNDGNPRILLLKEIFISAGMNRFIYALTYNKFNNELITIGDEVVSIDMKTQEIKFKMNQFKNEIRIHTGAIVSIVQDTTQNRIYTAGK
jgi:hypothetical protein